MDMSEYSIRDLGTFAEMFAKEGYFKMARLYLNEISERINAMKGLRSVAALTEPAVAAVSEVHIHAAKKASSTEARPNDLLLETKEPRLRHEPLTLTDEELSSTLAQAEESGEQIAPEPGMIRDEAGKVTHVSVQVGNPGYDPEIHENTALKIYCDGVHIETAHTADTVAGTVWYYEKNEQGRIKTLTVHGRVEIKGLD